jgi:NhaA family Na+:H+ antiporter
MTLLVVRMRWTSLPEGVSMRHIHGASCLAGIGFTMSLFIGELAFLGMEEIDEAKIGILAASVLAGVVGFVVLRVLGRSPVADEDGEIEPPLAAQQRDLAV